MTVEKLSSEDRRSAILDAAERSFIKRGFHRATMQDVAAEAGMSPGNLYRYFPSKETIVAGLAERDCAKIANDFEMLAQAPPSIEMLEEMARGYLIHESREHKIMELEIWAESTRNPAIGSICSAIQCEVDDKLLIYLERVRAAGLIASHVDVKRVLTMMTMLVDGFVRRRATDADFDAESQIEVVFATFRAALAGHLDQPAIRQAVA